MPGCGPRLIALGHGVFSPFRELQPEQVLRLFLEFAGWPEYPACSFHAAVQQVSDPARDATARRASEKPNLFSYLNGIKDVIFSFVL